MAGRAYRQQLLLLTLAIIVVNKLDCAGAPVSSSSSLHLRRPDVMDRDVTSRRTACQRRLSDDIDACLSHFEQVLASSGALHTKPGQLQPSVIRRLCRSAKLSLHDAIGYQTTTGLTNRCTTVCTTGCIV